MRGSTRSPCSAACCNDQRVGRPGRGRGVRARRPGLRPVRAARLHVGAETPRLACPAAGAARRLGARRHRACAAVVIAALARKLTIAMREGQARRPALPAPWELNANWATVIAAATITTTAIERRAWRALSQRRSRGCSLRDGHGG